MKTLRSIWDREISRRTFMVTSAVVAGTAAFLGRNASDTDVTATATDSETQPQLPERRTLTAVPSVCYMCGNNCALRVMVDADGRAVRIDPNVKNPGSAGKLCARAHASIQMLYDPDRLKGPMRKAADGEWESIGWDEALDTVHEKLEKIRQDYGPETVAFVSRRGAYGYAWNGLRTNYGSPNSESAPSVCDGAKRTANNFTMGTNSEMSDFINSKYIILIGASQMEAPRYRLRHGRDILEAQRNGAKLVVVDPRFSYTASKADEYLGIKPGTDGLFILSLTHVIVKEELYNQEFVEAHGNGWDVFKAEVLKDDYAPDNAAVRTGIPADTIERIAREFADNHPAVIDSSSGIHKYTNGTLNHWALMNLNALVGSIEVPGGKHFCNNGSLKWPSISGNNVSAKRHYEEGGWSFGPDLPMHNRALISQAILNPHQYPAGPKIEAETTEIYGGHGIKGMFVFNTDSFAAQSGTDELKNALGQLEFGVGVDLYLTSTLDSFPIGSIVLPETTFLERSNAYTPRSFVPYVSLALPAVKPLWDAKDSHWIFTMLGKRFGFEGFANLDENGLDDIVKSAVIEAEQAGGVRIDWDQIVEDGVWEAENYTIPQKRYDRLPAGHWSFAFVGNIGEKQQHMVDATGFLTPVFQEPARPTAEFPLRFLAGGKVLWLTQGNHRNLSYLMQVFDEMHHVQDTNFLVMHPNDADARGIQDRDPVVVKSAVSEISAHAFITERAQPGFTHMVHGFGHESKLYGSAYKRGANPNYLIDSNRFDVSGNFTCNEQCVEVVRA